MVAIVAALPLTYSWIVVQHFDFWHLLSLALFYLSSMYISKNHSVSNKTEKAKEPEKEE
jgi:hypothetical protein